MKYGYLVSSFFTLGSFISTSVANAAPQAAPLYELDGTIQTTIQVAPPNLSRLASTPYSAEELSGFKTITLMKLKPTPELQKRMALRTLSASTITNTEKDFSTSFTSFSESPGATDIGMGAVPVLNQGSHGTCVTFSSTAALDVLINKGDYIDQQCSLELDLSLGQNYWNGANYASQIIDPLKKYGVIQKGKCFGHTYSPTNLTTEKLTLSIQNYKNASDKTLLTNVKYNYYSTLTLEDIKTAIQAGHRVVIGFPLKSSDQVGDVGVDGFAIGANKTGLWACSQPSSPNNYCSNDYNAGHEVIVIGYDENQQLLKIRNSWSDLAGDEGNYYMTFKYFNSRPIDGTEVY